MSGWGEFASAWALFLLAHLVPVRRPVKPWLVARIGPSGFGLVYSILSIGILAWLFNAASRAPHVLLWHMPTGGHWIVFAITIPAVGLVALTVGRPNPFSFGGSRDHLFDPDRPELAAWIRHPVLVALGLWAGAHLIVNGNFAHAIMFSGFITFSMFGMVVVDRRKQIEMGRDEWKELCARSRLAGLTLPPDTGMRLVIGICALSSLILGHRWLSGVTIWARFLP